MKKLVLPLLVLLGAGTFGQTNKSCCSISPTEKFALLASNKTFSAAHADPLPVNFTPAKGTMIKYSTGDGMEANAFEVKSVKPTNNWIIMVHEWWGLNDYIKKEAERLQDEVGNANVLAVDLYDGNVAMVAADAQKYMGGLKEERAVSILKGAIAYTGAKANIYTIGWCMGGGWSLQTTLLAGKQAAGCVMYYGMPETDVSKLKTISADVLGIFAKKDQWINQQVVDKFKADMLDIGKKLIVKSYDADHAFANPSNPHYDKIAGEDAHKQALLFLMERMK